MTGDWFDTAESMEMITKLNYIAERSVRTDRTSVAEITVVVDEKSLLYIAMNSDLYD